MSRRGRRGRTVSGLALAALLAPGLAGCGVYGPPRRADEPDSAAAACPTPTALPEPVPEPERPEDDADGH